jgi:hypothetical protein
MGFRLPVENREWVRHDLTDAGWRIRLILRHLSILIPICAVLAILPADWTIRLMVALLAFLGSVFVVVVNAGDIRQARLRQHRISVPDDPERGHPSH